MQAKYYAYIKRSGGDDWGRNLRAQTERAARREARILFADDYRDAVIYVCEWYDGVKIPVATVPVFGGRWRDM